MMPDSKTILATYRFESEIDPEKAAEHLAMEQSTAQWKRPGVDEDFRPQHGAKIADLKILEKTAGRFVCDVQIAHPHINFGPKIPNLLTALCGEGAFYSPGITTIKLCDIDFPENYLREFEGPQFGIIGLRDFLGIYERPFFFGVVKPNVGLPPKDFAELAYQSWLGGLDAPKDDEMLADTGYSPLAERMRLVGALRKKAEKETGEKKMFVANITDEADRLVSLYNVATENGANCVMLNSWALGLSACRMVRKLSKVPMLAHFDFIAAFTRVPNFGMSTALATKLQRLAGFDVILFPGFGARMRTTEEEVLANVRACLDPMGRIKPALPVPGGSDVPENLARLYATLKTVDFGVVPGRAVFNHPQGPKAGAVAFREAWEKIQWSQKNKF